MELLLDIGCPNRDLHTSILRVVADDSLVGIESRPITPVPFGDDLEDLADRLGKRAVAQAWPKEGKITRFPR